MPPGSTATPARRLVPPITDAIARLPEDEAPRLLVVIDTEEEFDWAADFDREQRSVAHMRDIASLQAVFDEFAIRATWVVDHPIATQTDGAEPLRELATAGRAEIGAHLHPWVSPPFDEEVTRAHSYPGNLPAELERAKLATLVDAIEAGIGVRPTVYKAGRYGLGPNTAATLAELGFAVDLSPCPPFDFGADGGPDYSGFPADPFWFGPRAGNDGGPLLAIPTTGAYVGFLPSHGLYRWITRPALAPLRLPGILSRLGAVERLMLSPEGFEPVHHERITRALLARGVRTFTFSFHSPSVRPGCTPYVRTEADRVQFLDACRRYFEFFLGRLGGRPTTALGLRADLLRSGAQP